MDSEVRSDKSSHVSTTKRETPQNHKIKAITAKRAHKGKTRNLGPEMRRDFLITWKAKGREVSATSQHQPMSRS